MKSDEDLNSLLMLKAKGYDVEEVVEETEEGYGYFMV